jgi:hypothetical protein
LVCIDVFYIGKLKGVGKVWQCTACDAASSYTIATVLPQVMEWAVAHLPRTHVARVYHRAGHRIRAVLTDGGPEFQGVFRAACAGHRASADQTAARLDQWLRRAAPGDDPHGVVSREVVEKDGFPLKLILLLLGHRQHRLLDRRRE